MALDHSDSERGNLLPPLHGLVFLVRSGQVRVFNVHIQSKLLYRTPVMGTGTKYPGQEEKGAKGVRGPPALVGTRVYEQSDRNRYQAEGV